MVRGVYFLELLRFTDKTRFLSKFSQTKGCWIWKGNKNKDGYGVIYLKGKMYLAHRVSLFFFKQLQPKNLVLHKCDNPSCVNPNHLFEGTQLENIKDMVNKNRQTRPIGEKNPNCKLSFEVIKEIKRWFSIGMSRMEVSQCFKISWEHANSIKLGLTRRFN